MRICDGLRFKMAYLLLYNLYSYLQSGFLEENLSKCEFNMKQSPIGDIQGCPHLEKKNLF